MFCPNCGKEIDDKAVICVGCGQQIPRCIKNNLAEPRPSAGWWWLGFFLPVIGFILWIVWNDSAPLKAKKCGIGALVGIIVSVVLSIICLIAIPLILARFLSAMEYSVFL